MNFLYGLKRTKNLEKNPFLSEPFSKLEVGCNKNAIPVHF